jgi:hypothetical protein
MTDNNKLNELLYGDVFLCSGSPVCKVMEFLKHRVRLYRRWKSMAQGNDKEEVKSVIDNLMSLSHEIISVLDPENVHNYFSNIEDAYQWFIADSPERREYLINLYKGDTSSALFNPTK